MIDYLLIILRMLPSPVLQILGILMRQVILWFQEMLYLVL